MKLIPLLTKMLKAFPTVTSHANVNGTYSTTEISIGNIAILLGYFNIQPKAASTSTTKTIYFGRTFKTTYGVHLTLCGQPQITTLILSLVEYTTNSFIAHIFASNTTNRGARFIAIGKV